MNRISRDVGGYRGRRTMTDILKMIAIILGVLVVLAVAAAVYLQRYMVYTDEGMKLDLPPFLQALRRGEEEPPASASIPDLGDLSIDIQPAGSQTQPQQPQQPERAGFALALPVSAVTDGTAADRLAEAGAEALVLEVKDREGKLAWLSGQRIAGQAKANGTQETTDALRQWNAGEVYTIARVCCFRDNSAPYYRNPLALRSRNGNWKDELGLRWLSPAQKEAQAYIAGLCGELAGLGFDEIVLEDFHFPVQGLVGNIRTGESYDSAQFTPALEAFLSQVQQAVEPYGTKISLRVGRDTLTGAEALSGVTAPLLEQYAHRLWVEEDGLLPPPQDLLEPAGIGGGTDRLVEIVAQAGEERTCFQAVIAPEG